MQEDKNFETIVQAWRERTQRKWAAPDNRQSMSGDSPENKTLKVKEQKIQRGVATTSDASTAAAVADSTPTAAAAPAGVTSTPTAAAAAAAATSTPLAVAVTSTPTAAATATSTPLAAATSTLTAAATAASTPLAAAISTPTASAAAAAASPPLEADAAARSEDTLGTDENTNLVFQKNYDDEDCDEGAGYAKVKGDDYLEKDFADEPCNQGSNDTPKSDEEDNMDGVYVKRPPPSKARLETSSNDDDDCALKCVYFTLQCCQCSVM